MEQLLLRSMLVLAIALGSLPSFAGESSDSPSSTSSDEKSESLSQKDKAKADDDDDDKETVSGNISHIRSADGEYDVFFVGRNRGYSVPSSLPNWTNKEQTPDQFLQAAHKNQTPVTVTINKNTDAIIAIEGGGQARAPASDLKVPEGYDFLKDIPKKAKE